MWYVIYAVIPLLILFLILLGIDHPQGPGKLNHKECQVRLSFYKPEDLEECPYIIFTSHGVHTHPPPVPSRPAPVIVDGLIQVIRRINDPSLTTGKYNDNTIINCIINSILRYANTS